MDRSTVLGLVIGFVCVIGGYLLEGGSVGSLGGESAALIVIGGTVGAVVISYPLADLKRFPQWIKIAFTERPYGNVEAYHTLIRFAEKARREGLLSLELELETVTDRYTRQGLQLVIDGTDPEITREILESNITVLEKRHKVGIAVFESAGGFAPTMGIVGTVMGLVMVLGNLTDPEHLAHAIAVAFLATLYGVATANLIYFPLGTKLKMKDKEEVASMEMVMNGILSIQAGENPSILKEKLKTYLGSANVSDRFDESAAVSSRQAASSTRR